MRDWLFQSLDHRLTLKAEGVFPSREHSGLDEIVTQFLNSQARAGCRMLRVAGPVRNARWTSNLPGRSKLPVGERTSVAPPCSDHDLEPCLGHREAWKKKIWSHSTV